MLRAGTRPGSVPARACLPESRKTAGFRLLSMVASTSGLEGLVNDNAAINGHSNDGLNGSEASFGVIGMTNGKQKTKLHGRAFYKSIGSPKFVLAPMVDQSEFVSSDLLMLQHYCSERR